MPPAETPPYQDARLTPAVLICVTDDAAQFSVFLIAQEGAKVVETAAGIRNLSPFLSFLRHGCRHLTYIILGWVAKDGVVC